MADFLGTGAYDTRQREQALSNPYQKPPTPADSMTQATLDGIDTAGQQYAAQKQQQAVMNTVTRRLTQGLLGSKAAYEQGQDLYNNASNDDEAYAGQLLMDKAAQQAQSIRQSAGAAGLDLSRFGEGITLQQARQNLQDDTTRGLANVFGNRDMTSDDYYNQQYQALRAKHYTENDARDEAARRAGAYQAQRLSRLSDAFQNYGVNDNGALNNDGVRILNMMANEDANVANNFAQMYATPKAEYTTQVAQDAANTKFQRDVALSDRKAQQQAALNDRKDLHALERTLARGTGSGNGGGLTQKEMLNQYYQEGLDLFDGDDDKAKEYAYEKVNQIKSSGKPSKNDKYDGMDKKTWDELNQLKVDLEKAEKLVRQGSGYGKDSEERKMAVEESGALLEPLQERINKLEASLNEDTFAGLQNWKDNIEKSRNTSLLELKNPENLDYFGKE